MAFKFVILSTILAVVSAGYLAPAPTHYAAAPVFNAKVANPAVDAVALTHQNVVRSFGGTVSQYSKSIQTPYSSAHKEDTRVNNNVYTPTVAKTITYAAPIGGKTVSYAPAHLTTLHSAPVYAHQEPTHAVYASSLAPHTVYTHEKPANNVYASPTPTAAVFTHQHEVPSTATTTYNHGPAATTYTHSSPAVFTHHHEVPSTATTTYNHGPAATTYTHSSPAVFTHHHEVPSTATTIYNHGPAATTYTHNSPAVSAYGTSQTVQYSPAEMVSHMSFDGFGTHWGY